MTAIEVALILIGVVFLLGSFFVSEKLSPEDVTRVAELSEDELRIVMDRELEIANAKISDMAEQTIDLSMNQIRRTMEKDSNEKIMAISEYSDSVIEKLKKMNNEVTFLYSMLGDKHNELNECMAQLNGLLAECRSLKAELDVVQTRQKELQDREAQMAEVRMADPIPRRVTKERVVAVAEVQEDYAEEPVPTDEMRQALEAMEQMEQTSETETADVKNEILKQYRAGEDLRDIARNLGLGYGEVKLIVELYKGDKNL